MGDRKAPQPPPRNQVKPAPPPAPPEPRLSLAAAEKTPLMVRCEDCGHRWACVYLPMEMAKAAKVMKAHSMCPRCGGRQVFTSMGGDR